MQAPGFRMNEREANPNPYVGFIRSLRVKDDHTDAEMILRAVAAQMKKIMEHRFMFVGTLEEAEHNLVFAGRNWNYGQSIELVLRGPTGRFLPLRYITSVMCHEMAHIQHMNHGPKFQKLNAEIKEEVRVMQARGYFGDGFWSDGHRLKDNVKMGGEGLRPADFPEYVCGVTAGDARKAKRPRRGPRASAAPGLVKGEASHRSGRQTDYNRKAGRRNNVEMGASSGRLDGKQEITKEVEDRRKEDIEQLTQEYLREGLEIKKAKAKATRKWKKDNAWYTEGNSRGRVAKSKTAAELRAAAAEKRLAALAGPSTSMLKEELVSEDDGSDVDPDDEDVPDPHQDASSRKREMDQEMDEEEKQGLRGGWEEFFPSLKHRSNPVKRELSPHTDEGMIPPRKRPASSSRPRFGASMVDTEIKKDLGLVADTDRKVQILGGHGTESGGDLVLSADGRPGWSCKVCTYANIADHGRCEMCGARPDGTLVEEV